MSKAISAALKAHLALDCTTVATCYSIYRRDGTEYHFTSHIEDIVFEGDTYLAANAMMEGAQSQARGVGVGTVELAGFLDDDAISEDDLRAGRFDGASVDIFIVNHEDLTMGAMYYAKGWIMAPVESRENDFTTELRNRNERLQQSIVEVCSETCRAELFDARCGVSESGHVESGTITSVTSRKKFIDTGRTETEDLFAYGIFQITTSGSLNEGIEMEVRSYNFSTKEFLLFEPLPFAVVAGDTYDVTWGCDKYLATCLNRFNNVVNFRGEPYVPGSRVPTELIGRDVWGR